MIDASLDARPSHSRARTLAWLLVAALGLAGLLETGHQYSDFVIPQVGLQWIDMHELSFFAWYTFWGSVSVVGLTLGLVHTRLVDWLCARASGVLRRTRLVIGCAALVVLLAALLIRHGVLLGEPIADDESTYVFEAQTLARGRVVNPSPSQWGFVTNHFVVVDDVRWYGKYPIGHPALLALGEVVGLRDLVVPLLGALSLVMAFLLGRRLFGVRAAVLGAVLLAVSPQFVWTHATQLSQPSSAFFTLLLMTLAHELAERPRASVAFAAGCAAGALMLIRPMPGVFFVIAAVIGQFVLSGAHKSLTALRRTIGVSLVAVPGLLAAAAVLAYSNHEQSGSIWISGYQTVHGSLGTGSDYANGEIATSVGGAVLRQNFWLFGWVCSFAFIPFARVLRGATLFWGIIIAEFFYRVVQAKTVVATTGPIYVFEIVPLLALATGDGMLRAVRVLERLTIARARAWVTAATVSATVVAALGFVPVQLSALGRAGAVRTRVYQLLAARHATHAVVFANVMTAPEHKATWAYFPPNPNPDLSDDLVFLRRPWGRGSARQMHDYWRRRFPDRRAFMFDETGKGLSFTELTPVPRPSANAETADLFVAPDAAPPLPPPAKSPGPAAQR